MKRERLTASELSAADVGGADVGTDLTGADPARDKRTGTDLTAGIDGPDLTGPDLTGPDLTGPPGAVVPPPGVLSVQGPVPGRDGAARDGVRDRVRDRAAARDGARDGASPDEAGSTLRAVPADAGRELAVQFAAVARALESESTVEATMQRVVQVAASIVSGCHSAGITVLRRGRPETPAATDDVSAAVDAVQYEAGEGPCLSAIVEHETFRTGDLAAESRWPRFSRPAVERTGVRSVLAYRLFTSEDTFGALNLYSRDRDAFDDDSLAVGSVLAAHAALAFARARERELISGLEQAVASNRGIGTAIGILMAIRRVSQDEAFDLLRTVSQRSNRKLREIAEEVVLTGELPTAPVSRHS